MSDGDQQSFTPKSPTASDTSQGDLGAEEVHRRNRANSSSSLSPVSRKVKAGGEPSEKNSTWSTTDTDVRSRPAAGFHQAMR